MKEKTLGAFTKGENYFVSENDGFQMKNNEKTGGILAYAAHF